MHIITSRVYGIIDRHGDRYMPAGFHSSADLNYSRLASKPGAHSQISFSMDSIFFLGEGDRAAFLKQIMQSFGCVYICLWSDSHPPSNFSCLRALDGLYREVSNQPSSSSGSLAMRLFEAYRDLGNYVDDTRRIPGLAFKNNFPYMELKLHDFQSLVSSEVQLQFYQEAGIKTVVFMGCPRGEIELGLSDDPQVDLETEMKNLILSFSQQAMSGELPYHTDPNQPPSSSSSSLRSLSVDSPEYSPLLFNIPTTSTSFVPQPLKEALLKEAFIRSVPVSPPITTNNPHDQARQALNQIRNIQFPTIESEDAAMTKAILAVLSSSPSTSSSSQQTPQNLPPICPLINHNPTAFRRYRATSTPVAAIPQKHSKFKRAVLFFRNLNMRRRQELQVQGNRPTATQMHHMISERRRREKLNESFQLLRSLLPPGSKKDKASVLGRTTEYLSSLKSQVAELSQRNQMLESKISAQRSEASADQVGGSSNSVERINVQIAQVSSSTSEARFLDLRVTVRGESSMLDLVIRLLEFLKQQRNVSLLSVESNTTVLESIPVHGVMLRLKIEGDEFDESGFQEAVRRVVDDQAH